MLIYSWIWQTLSRQLRCGGAKSDHTDNLAIASGQLQQSGYLLQPDHSDAIDVFDPVTLSELRRAAHLCRILRPASRDQIRYRAVRQR